MREALINTAALLCVILLIGFTAFFLCRACHEPKPLYCLAFMSSLLTWFYVSGRCGELTEEERRRLL
jgi:hypothetical protein